MGVLSRLWIQLGFGVSVGMAAVSLWKLDLFAALWMGMATGIVECVGADTDHC